MSNQGKILRILEKRYPVEEYREDPFRVLIGVILSHRTTDKISWPIAEKLFQIAKTPQQFSKVSPSKIKKTIKSVNYYKTKARRIKAVSNYLAKEFGGKVPRKREELLRLPGIGGKSSDIILSHAYGEPVIAVDTHVATVSKRLGWTKEKDPEKIRKDLHNIFDEKQRKKVNSILVDFGKEICKSPKPRCYLCPVEKHCPYPFKNMKKNN